MVRGKPNTLIIDDEEQICELLSCELTELGYQCETAFDGYEALTKLASKRFKVVLLDIRLPGISGMDILRDIQLNHPLCSTIMITAIGELDTAVEAMKLGAADYIVKPFDLGKVAMSIRNALKEKNSALFLHQMDAISMGVEERIDPFHAYTRIVVERTVDVARQLHIPENVIKKWVESKTLCAAHKTAAKISDHVEPSMHSS